jgi:oligoribonuclease (3'-5' exoribonuclease)
VIRAWYPNNPHAEFKKKDLHRAMPDVLESIEELQHYRKHFFVNPLD